MDAINFTVHRSRSLPFFRKNVTATLTASCHQSELSRLGFELQKVIATITGSSNLIENCKGRNDELFFLSGILPIDESDLEDEDGITFEYSVLTSFENMASPGKFTEKVSERLIGDIPEDIDAKNLTWLAPAFPKLLRAGMEFYAPHSFSASLGLAPVLREYFEVVCTEESVRLTIYSEGSQDPKSALLSNSKIWDGLCGAFQNTAGISLSELYLSQK